MLLVRADDALHQLVAHHVALLKFYDRDAVYALQRAAGLSLEVAEMVTLEAHREGEAVVRRALTQEDALIMCAGLRKWSRIEGISPGVHCEAQPDDP